MDEQVLRRPGRREGPRVAVELLVQHEGQSDRQLLRVVVGTPIREVLLRAGHAAAIAGIEAGSLALGVGGRRAGLDAPILAAQRVEVLLPITADAKAWRHRRVAERRARRRA